jgi:clan AA aspartic protease (TIGR02281 family)
MKLLSGLRRSGLAARLVRLLRDGEDTLASSRPTTSSWLTLLVGIATVGALAGPAAGQVYRWTDADGGAHFAQDLGQVPPSQRAAALARANQPADDSPIQRYEIAPARRAPLASSSRAAASAPETYEIPVERAGTSMIVTVRLNNRVNARFLVDTGASDVLLPQRVANELGLRPSGRTKVYSTANGLVTHDVVSLDSVALGGARARGVMASVSPSMSIGLLGLSFFNRFKYSVDPGQGVIRLTPNGLEQAGEIRAGRSRAQWRAEYGNLRMRIDQIEGRQSRVMTSHSRTHAQLEKQLQDIEGQLAVLDGEADQAHVPYSWRR